MIIQTKLISHPYTWDSIPHLLWHILGRHGTPMAHTSSLRTLCFCLHIYIFYKDRAWLLLPLVAFDRHLWCSHFLPHPQQKILLHWVHWVLSPRNTWGNSPLPERKWFRNLLVVDSQWKCNRHHPLCSDIACMAFRSKCHSDGTVDFHESSLELYIGKKSCYNRILKVHNH